MGRFSASIINKNKKQEKQCQDKIVRKKDITN